MNSSILSEIGCLRGSQDFTIDYKNSNRHCIIVREPDSSRTAYCFGTPIYNKNTKRLVKLSFDETSDGFYHIGSSAEVKVSEREIVMKNTEGVLRIHGLCNFRLYEGRILFPGGEIAPTLNGIAVKMAPVKENKISLILTASIPFMETRANSKYFAFMSEKFRPFSTLSAIGLLGSGGNLTSPIQIKCQKINSKSYSVTLSTFSQIRNPIWFEINMYEPKLFQDTTVESKKAKENNAFGGIAFIGETEAFGETWLYTRPDFTKISYLLEKKARYVKLHLPVYNIGSATLSAYRTAARFCSFGSNWNNKIELSKKMIDTAVGNQYQTLDLTDSVINPKNHSIRTTDGFILRIKEQKKLAVVSTGDSYINPQILEINYFN